MFNLVRGKSPSAFVMADNKTCHVNATKDNRLTDAKYFDKWGASMMVLDSWNRNENLGTTTINDKEESFEVYQDDPFSPVNTLDKKFYDNLGKSFPKNKKIFVQSKSIDQIINLSGIKQNIDFINIDVEGSDYRVLTQIKINKLKPKLISIETHNVDGSKSENFPYILEYLSKNNYTIFKRVGPTTLFSVKQ